MSVLRWLADQRARPSSLANFDSSTTLLRALARHLHGEDFPALGLAPEQIASILPLGNYLPKRTRQRLYRRGTANEAIDPADLGDVRLEAIREWVVDRYPERGYPAVLVGSANGAAVHLAALLGIPWLPQTFLVPVRRDLDPDDPAADFEWGAEAARPLLEANPDLKLHQMHDPNQDRLPIERMSYFRVKSLRLGPAYEEFLRTVLEPGGRIVLLDCGLEWPTTRVDDRHVFQFGCIGGLATEEYFEGSDRVASFLERQGSDRRRWEPPEPDGERPESEWGFEPSLGEDVERFADRHGYRVGRLDYDHPRDPSPLVADLYRSHYADLGIPPTRLVVETFAQVEPWWALRTGSVPFWLSFNSDGDVEAIEEYLDSTDPFEEIYASLFSHGVESVGLASADQWRSVMDRAGTRGEFIGVDPDEYPLDYGTYVRFNAEFPDTVSTRHPLSTMSFDWFESFLGDRSDERVDWDWIEG